MTRDYNKNPAAVDALSSEQYYVTQESGTERPFTGEYVDNHEPGIYVDVVSGEPLFASVDKFDSATGWPSFTKPLDGDNIVEKSDGRHFMVRTEVRSATATATLGMFSSTDPRPRAGCATASIPRRCASSTATTSRPRVTGTT